jgi:uncharacterized GH25 family protein
LQEENTMHRSIFWLPLLAAPAMALAHSPYLLPTQFDATERDHITVEASFAEDFFVPDAVMKATDYHVTAPDGSKVTLTPIYARDLALLELDTKQTGTYRVSTGAREGRTSKAVLVKGEWKFLDEDEAAPAGAHVYDMKSLTQAEVYVSRGAPTDAALKPRGKGLEFQALTHPNRLLAGGVAQFAVLLDGKPLAQQALTLRGSGDYYNKDGKPATLHSDAKGVVKIPLVTPGVYHLMTRHRMEPRSAGATAESHTYALTFEVTE